MRDKRSKMKEHGEKKRKGRAEISKQKPPLTADKDPRVEPLEKR